MNNKYRVLIADKITHDGLTPLEQDDRFELERRTGLDQEALADALVDFDAVLVRSATKISAAALAKTERLKVIGRAGVGVDTIDVAAATEKGIPVLNAPAGNTTSAAELTFALLMALARRVVQRPGVAARSRREQQEAAAARLAEPGPEEVAAVSVAAVEGDHQRQGALCVDGFGDVEAEAAASVRGVAIGAQQAHADFVVAGGVELRQTPV